MILTTNRYDLLDKAVKDRLYPIEFPLPSKEALKEIAEVKCRELGMPTDEVVSEIMSGKFKSVRGLEKSIMEKYIEYAVGA